MTDMTPSTPPARQGRGLGKILLTVFGSVGALAALTLLVGALVLGIAHTQRDGEGFLTTSTERHATGSYALTHEGVRIGDISELPEWIDQRFGTVRVSATAAEGTPLFVGVAQTADVDRYLQGVSHEQVTDFGVDRTAPVAGGAPRGAPGGETFWAASTAGTGTQTLEWELAEGTWSIVLMNADASPGVAADVELGARLGFLATAGILVAILALLIGAASVAMLVFGLAGPRGGAAAVPAATPGLYPVAVEAQLDESLSRWRWLVKWVLAIPPQTEVDADRASPSREGV